MYPTFPVVTCLANHQSQFSLKKNQEILRFDITLRIPDSYHAKTLKKTECIQCFASYFHKSEHSFFDRVAIDVKSVLTFEKRPLVAELKFKMSQNGRFLMFSISALPPDTFSIYGHLVKKSCIQIFERRHSYKIIR